MNGNGKVIGVGISKTGTTTLGACFKHLEILPRKGHNKELMKKVNKGDIDIALTVAEPYRGLQDSPWSVLFRELDQRFPSSKFILTTRRDALTRAMSAWNHKLSKGAVQGKVMREYLESAQRAYESHNAAVREYFKDRPDDLLEVCWEKGDGWQKLCEFLSLPVPNIPFPHCRRGYYPTNDTERFQERPAILSRIKKLKTRIFNR